MGSFVDDIKAFQQKLNDRAEAAVRGAAQDYAEQVQLPLAKGGFMRVDTGFLRNSLQASLTQFPGIVSTARPAEGAAPNSYPENLDQINIVIAQAKADDTIYIGFTAAYARAREAKDGFNRMASQRWDATFYENALKAMAAFP